MTGGVVVVLGPVGRNFGAGMSGGVAYVLDDGSFAPRCAPSGLTVSPIDDQDEAVVTGLLEEHIALTGSAWGKELAERWSDARARFVRVVSPEYQRLFESGRARAESGLSRAASRHG
jgi:glutamate synthase domain-containing protein 3